MGTDWRAVAFTTAPAERARAEAGVQAAYAAAGLAAPADVRWVPSPAAGAIAGVLIAGGDAARALLEKAGLGNAAATIRAQLVPGPGRCVREQVRTHPWEAARAAACARLGPQEWSRAWSRTGALIWDPVHDLVSRIRQAISDMDPDDLLRDATLDAVLGQHDAPWLYLFDTLIPLADGPDGAAWWEGTAGLRALAQVARSAGWWWPYERLVVIAERPRSLHRDEAGLLHCPDGPALGFPDGFALHAWRGMPVPAGFLATLAELTPGRIQAEDNAELRRVMLEHYGYDRYLADLNAEPLHQDETGALWRINLPGEEPIVLVEVINSTPEPDGSHRTYHLRVPPGTRTARAGVAWTFGLDESSYQPSQQT